MKIKSLLVKTDGVQLTDNDGFHAAWVTVSEHQTTEIEPIGRSKTPKLFKEINLTEFKSKSINGKWRFVGIAKSGHWKLRRKSK